VKILISEIKAGVKETKLRRKDGDISELKKSIQECGLINPITINQNHELLAGRRRFQAIKELGWKETDVRVINSENELFDFKISLEENIKRKDLTDVELATAIKEYDKLKRKIYGSAKSGERTDLTLPQCSKVWTQQRTAEDLGISQQAVTKAIQIANAIEEYPELAKYKGTEVIKRHKLKKTKEKLSKIEILEDSNVKIFNEDFRNSKIEPESIDLILTDPPYGKEYLSLYENLSRFASTVLKPTGLLICYSGQIHLVEILNLLSGYLKYWWCGFIHLKGHHQSIMNRNIWCATRPILFFVRNDFIPDKWFLDYAVSEKQDKELNEWQQNPEPAKYYIERLTDKDGVILDPFLGTGTFGVVAREIGRKFIGYEKNKDNFEIARRRICGLTGKNI